MINQAYFPIGATQNIAVTATAQSLSLNAAHLEANGIRLANIGTQTVFVNFGQNGAATAATVAAAMPIPAGSTIVVGASRLTTLSVIAAATGSTLYATPVLGN